MSEKSSDDSRKFCYVVERIRIEKSNIDPRIPLYPDEFHEVKAGKVELNVTVWTYLPEKSSSDCSSGEEYTPSEAKGKKKINTRSRKYTSRAKKTCRSKVWTSTDENVLSEKGAIKFGRSFKYVEVKRHKASHCIRLQP